ncbi:MAG TPA: transcriptional regulator [Pseudomonas sp.]|nr:transcriptional regulator [Pseudomonas sp.]
MTSLIKQASEHWRYVAPLLAKPGNEDDYDALVNALDELLGMVGEDEDHPLASLAVHMGDLIEAYDEARRPLPAVGGIEVLRYLMQEHGLSQADLPEVGAQSVLSEILGGKRQLNVRQIRALATRFGVSAEVFF